jgi:hypothetical protein
MTFTSASLIRRLRRPLLLALATFAGALGVVTELRAETALQREDRIKAALIFKLVKFVDWPAQALAGKDPLQICALGSSAVGDALAVVDGRPARDRLAQFRRIGGLTIAEVKACHVLFIPAGAREMLTGNVVPKSLGVLTISDAPDFARRGGMIGLVRDENKIGFEINLHVARDAGLAPGASLLELATVVD